MLLHIDGSRHQWFQDDRWYDLLVILDDATSRIYYAQLVEEESTMTVLGALRKVIEQEGVFCALYSDRASHFFWTPRAGGKVDPERRTQVGRALKELGTRMIAAYSPQARGRSERGFVAVIVEAFLIKTFSAGIISRAVRPWRFLPDDFPPPKRSDVCPSCLPPPSARLRLNAVADTF